MATRIRPAAEEDTREDNVMTGLLKKLLLIGLPLAAISFASPLQDQAEAQRRRGRTSVGVYVGPGGFGINTWRGRGWNYGNYGNFGFNNYYGFGTRVYPQPYYVVPAPTYYYSPYNYGYTYPFGYSHGTYYYGW